jgi:hypothetical protein
VRGVKLLFTCAVRRIVSQLAAGSRFPSYHFPLVSSCPLLSVKDPDRNLTVRISSPAITMLVEQSAVPIQAVSRYRET